MLYADKRAKRGQFRDALPINVQQEEDLKKVREENLRRRGLKEVRFSETSEDPDGTSMHMMGSRLVKDDDIRGQKETDEMRAVDAVEKDPDAVLEYLGERFGQGREEAEGHEQSH